MVQAHSRLGTGQILSHARNDQCEIDAQLCLTSQKDIPQLHRKSHESGYDSGRQLWPTRVGRELRLSLLILFDLNCNSSTYALWFMIVESPVTLPEL
jgi:hypothetical protein